MPFSNSDMQLWKRVEFASILSIVQLLLCRLLSVEMCI